MANLNDLDKFLKLKKLLIESGDYTLQDLVDYDYDFQRYEVLKSIKYLKDRLPLTTDKEICSKFFDYFTEIVNNYIISSYVDSETKDKFSINYFQNLNNNFQNLSFSNKDDFKKFLLKEMSFFIKETNIDSEKKKQFIEDFIRKHYRTEE